MTKNFRIVHCFRAPVGGLFRHVLDLVTAQTDMGHDIGIICDSRTGNSASDQRLNRLAEHCTLGVARVAMSRQIGLRDFTAYRAVRRFALNTGANILHGHGAKGGAYARLAAASLRRRSAEIHAFYTPHGGSLHYDPATLKGRIFLDLERRLARRTDGLVFESAYSAGLFKEKVGPPACEWSIVPNGLWPHEFYEITLDTDAVDFLFVGELRQLKGVDVLLQALAAMPADRKVRGLIVGSGPDEARFKRQAARLALKDRVTFSGAMAAQKAFARARCMVVPSRAESFPYIVLEAAAAQLPMILTNAGGIPEIIKGTDIELVPPGDSDALKAQMAAFLDNPAKFVDRAKALQSIVSERYTAAGMAQAVTEFYGHVYLSDAEK